ncbi:hypothetical protein N9544_01245 [Flavobacteriales bacterium]|nr:hypothetical protein [Flavobacteriales bacterium]
MKIMVKCTLVLLGLSILVSCGGGNKSNIKEEAKISPEVTSVQEMEQQHQKEQFLSEDNIQFDLELYFGGKERMKGIMIFATNSSQGLLELKDGNKIYFIKDKVYYSPDMNEKRVRFDAYTWSYFFLFPYKLSDEGTIWSELEKVEMNENWYNTQKLTFKNGTGDAPDDWYQVYSDTVYNLIQVAAYIVTGNKSVEKAEEDPHAIAYKNYQYVNGIPIATNWEFYSWTKTEGLTDTLGKATLSNFKFVDDSDSLFIPPTHFLSID